MRFRPSAPLQVRDQPWRWRPQQCFFQVIRNGQQRWYSWDIHGMVRNGLKHQQESNPSIKNDELAGYYWDILWVSWDIHEFNHQKWWFNDFHKKIWRCLTSRGIYTVQLLPPAYGTSVGIIWWWTAEAGNIIGPVMWENQKKTSLRSIENGW